MSENEKRQERMSIPGLHLWHPETAVGGSWLSLLPGECPGPSPEGSD